MCWSPGLCKWTFQLFLSHFLSQDKGQKSSAYRKTHKLFKGLLTSIEHHNLKAMARTSSGAVVSKYKIQYPLLWTLVVATLKHQGSIPCPWSTSQHPTAVVSWFLLSVYFCAFTLEFCEYWERVRRESQYFTWLKEWSAESFSFFCFYEPIVPPNSSKLGKHLLCLPWAGQFFSALQVEIQFPLGFRVCIYREISCLFFSSQFPIQNVSASFSVSTLYINECVGAFTTY